MRTMIDHYLERLDRYEEEAARGPAVEDIPIDCTAAIVARILNP